MKEIIVTEKELIKAFLLNSKKSLTHNKWKLIAVEICFIIAAFFLNHYLPGISTSAILILVFFMPLTLICVLVSIPLELKKQYKQNPYLTQPRNVTWDQEFLYSRTEFLESKFPWVNFISILESDDLILLYELPKCFSIYPKRAFDGKEEIEEFLSFARQGSLTKSPFNQISN